MKNSSNSSKDSTEAAATPEIRRPTGADHEIWLRMRNQFWPQCDVNQHRKEMDVMLGREDAAVFLAFDGEKPAGFIELTLRREAEGCHSSPVGYVEGWFVEQVARGKGVGKALIEAGENWAREQGCVEMASDTGVPNEAGQKAHLALGFGVVDHLVHFRKEIG